MITDGRLVIKNWASDLEGEALEQAINLANLPFAYHHIAIMPDAHKGYGMPIGGVLATEGVVIPNAVGYDCGCGMHAIRTDLLKNEMTEKVIIDCIARFREKIPVGFKHHEEAQDVSLMPANDTGYIIDQQYESALKQMGTLGSGNHFIEIQYDDSDRVWFMIHSGSRNLGYQVAKYYDKIAKNLNKRWHVSVPKNYDLAFLPIETSEAKDYMRDMKYCIEFARLNRELMMIDVRDVVRNIVRTFSFGSEIDIAHNYAAFEHHYGKNVLVHRKGATRARKGEFGIIPGSQGSNSYIVRGLGNKDSFMSCSHGAGRIMGRKEAKRKLNLEDEQCKLSGIAHSVRDVNDLDESVGAYKDINEVMKNQKDLVEIVYTLKPLGVLKG